MAGLLSQQMPQEQMPQDEGSDELSPQYEAAIKWMYAALYENNAGKNIAAAVSKSQDKPDTLANMAYEITGVGIEKSSLPEEDWIPYAAAVLAKVATIAESVDSSIDDMAVAQALSIMIERFIGEMGGDTRSLRAAFDQYTPEMMKQAFDYVGGQDGERE